MEKGDGAAISPSVISTWWESPAPGGLRTGRNWLTGHCCLSGSPVDRGLEKYKPRQRVIALFLSLFWTVMSSLLLAKNQQYSPSNRWSFTRTNSRIDVSFGVLQKLSVCVCVCSFWKQPSNYYIFWLLHNNLRNSSTYISFDFQSNLEMKVEKLLQLLSHTSFPLRGTFFFLYITPTIALNVLVITWVCIFSLFC